MVRLVDNIFSEVTEDLAEVLRKVSASDTPRVVLVSDMNVVNQTEGLGTKIGTYFNAHGIKLCGKPIILAGGERIKLDSMSSAMKAMNGILDAKVGKNDIVLALGGGTVLDVAGYAAAQVRGGTKLVRIPTTVAAMIDAAYAETASIDSGTVKDAFRVKSVPDAVLVDRKFAMTILDGVWRAGFSEAARLAAACDAKLMDFILDEAENLRRRDESAMFEVIGRCFKTRQRKSPMNFGEWSALRLESMSNYKLPHGYAIAIGVMIDATYSMLKGFLSQDEWRKIADFMNKCGAMDGAVHSRHLVNQVDTVMFGLDAWELAYGDEGIYIPNGLGKLVQDKKPDRDTMQKAINMIK
jgi:3-dehydroquinate synthase